MLNSYLQNYLLSRLSSVNQGGTEKLIWLRSCRQVVVLGFHCSSVLFHVFFTLWKNWEAFS